MSIENPQPSEAVEESLLRIHIAELQPPFNELTVEEFQELRARQLARSARQLEEATDRALHSEIDGPKAKGSLYEGLGLVDPARTRRSQSRVLYRGLGIQEKARSKAQSRVIGGMPGGRY